jgi:membrane protein implicated in regulation of membrane protease activity
MLPGTVEVLFTVVYSILFVGSAIWVGLTRDRNIWYYYFYEPLAIVLYIILSVAIVLFY